jgi:Uma2 family endonuclease
MRSRTRAVAGMGAPHSPRKITVDEYYEMARVGLIDPDARVELIDGEIVAMAPIGNPHGYVVDVLNDRLCATVHGRAKSNRDFPAARSEATAGSSSHVSAST